MENGLNPREFTGEELQEAIESVPPRDMSFEEISELGHRLAVAVLQAALEDIIPSANMRITEASPMSIGHHLAREVEKLLKINQ